MNMCTLPERQNPKLIQAEKDGKIPMEYLVYSVLEDDAYCHKAGADQYGVRNWLIDRIKASTYEGAMLRHFNAWAEGEDLDPDDGRPHLTHLRACCAIVLDAKKHGTLIDDRNRVESKDKTEGEQNDNTTNVRTRYAGRGEQASGSSESGSPYYSGSGPYECAKC